MKVSLQKIVGLLFLAIFVALSPERPGLSHLAIQQTSKETAYKNVFKVIGSGAPGSGVLVILPDRKAAILTSKHVVAGLGRSESVEVILTSSLRLEIPKANIINIPGMDLSILLVDRQKLESSPEIFMASMIQPDAVVRGQNVMVAGYPVSSNSISDTIRISPGIIQTTTDGKKSDGYDIGYSSQTYVGMSGGALLSPNGLLIGIHGRGEAISTGDVNKTGTNYAVSIKKVFDFYRNRQSGGGAGSGSGATSIVEASRQILFRDYKKALGSWSAIAAKYPESFIASYNRDCLKERLGQQKLDRARYPLLFEARHSHTTVVNPYFLGRGPGVAYLNDPLVKQYKPTIKNDDPLIHSWEMAFLSALVQYFEVVRAPQGAKYKFPDLGDECVLFSLAKYDKYSAKIFPPIVPTPYIYDTIRP